MYPKSYLEHFALLRGIRAFGLNFWLLQQWGLQIVAQVGQNIAWNDLNGD